MQGKMMVDEGAPEPRMLRFVLEMPADGLKELIELLTPLAHVAYRSDLWLTERREGGASRSNDVAQESVSREPL